MKDLLEPEEFETSYIKGNIGRRYLAAAFDYFLILFPYSLFRPIGPAHANEYLFLLAIWLLYFPFAEGMTGKTLGKSICKLRVVNEDFTKIHLGTALLRRLFDIIDNLPFLGIVGLIVASSNNKKQRVGDLIAKTIVIKK
jgi:uncharacterized RDD family membrane protein YckC